MVVGDGLLGDGLLCGLPVVLSGNGLAVVVGAGLLFCWASAGLKTPGNSVSQPSRCACTRTNAATSNNSTAPSTAITDLKPTTLLSPPPVTAQL